MRYGTLEVITGPMTSGKTTLLIGKIAILQEDLGQDVLVLKPAFDRRYAEHQIVTHDGAQADAVAIHTWPDIPEGIRAVMIDEVQFFQPPVFDSDLPARVRELLSRGIDVVAAGLDMDWRGHPFPVTASLVAMADHVTKLKAICHVCGNAANKTFKRFPNDRTIELGAGDKYQARCNLHWHVRGEPEQDTAAA
jgi:thymidine kinase